MAITRPKALKSKEFVSGSFRCYLMSRSCIVPAAERLSGRVLPRTRKRGAWDPAKGASTGSNCRSSDTDAFRPICGGSRGRGAYPSPKAVRHFAFAVESSHQVESAAPRESSRNSRCGRPQNATPSGHVLPIGPAFRPPAGEGRWVIDDRRRGAGHPRQNHLIHEVM